MFILAMILSVSSVLDHSATVAAGHTATVFASLAGVGANRRAIACPPGQADLELHAPRAPRTARERRCALVPNISAEARKSFTRFGVHQVTALMPKDLSGGDRAAPQIRD